MSAPGPQPLAVKSDRPAVPEMVSLEGFSIDPCAVSNLRFGAFVDATGYVTDAERYGWSFVFGGLLPDEFPDTRGAVQAPWWRQVFGAYWRQPEGFHSSIEERLDHPVVQISWRDAEAFCRWSDMRLPSETEWEYAARGGLVEKRFPWGDELEPGGEYRMNVWQGTFPAENTLEDGFLGTCPVDQPKAAAMSCLLPGQGDPQSGGPGVFLARDRGQSDSQSRTRFIRLPKCSL
jgi:sulfatase modifying factor 1